MTRMSEVPEVRSSEVEYAPDSLAEQVEAILIGLTAHLTDVLAHRPAEPEMEDHVHDIPLDAWRQAIVQWCGNSFVSRQYPEDLLEGLAHAVLGFDDEDLRDFLLSLI